MYTIISINEERASNKEVIKNNLFNMFEITDIEFVDGNDDRQLAIALGNHLFVNLTQDWVPLRGELGVWLSQLNCWKWMVKNEIAELLVIEDDALVVSDAVDIIKNYHLELPEDWDVLACAVPGNQYQDYEYRVIYDSEGVPKPVTPAGVRGYQFDFGAANIARLYQGYCCVANIYSYNGAKKLLKLADEYGLYSPVDCFISMQAHAGRLNAYAPKPTSAMPVYPNFNAPTQIHNTERIKTRAVE